MKVLLQTSSWFVIIALILSCHMSIINKNYRDSMINNNLQQATDYAFDCMIDYYRTNSTEYLSKYDGELLMGVNLTEEQQRQKAALDAQWTADCMQQFNIALQDTLTSDGEVTVSVLASDVVSGTFDIVVAEVYSYKLFGKTGTCTCERAVTFEQ